MASTTQSASASRSKSSSKVPRRMRSASRGLARAAGRAASIRSNPPWTASRSRSSRSTARPALAAWAAMAAPMVPAPSTATRRMSLVKDAPPGDRRSEGTLEADRTQRREPGHERAQSGVRRLLPHRRPPDRRRARGPGPGPGLLRQGGHPGHQRLLGAGRVPLRAGAQAGRPQPGRRHHRGLRLPGAEHGRHRPGRHGAGPGRRQHLHLLRGPLGPGHDLDRPARLRGAEAALAAGHGPDGADRRLRPDRARPRLGRGRARDHAPAATATTGCWTGPSAGSATPPSPTW